MRCLCRVTCGDAPERPEVREVCVGLPAPRPAPLVEIVLVSRDEVRALTPGLDAQAVRP